jgi:hypothetical protein
VRCQIPDGDGKLGMKVGVLTEDGCKMVVVLGVPKSPDGPPQRAEQGRIKVGDRIIFIHGIPVDPDNTIQQILEGPYPLDCKVLRCCGTKEKKKKKNMQLPLLVRAANDSEYLKSLPGTACRNLYSSLPVYSRNGRKKHNSKSNTMKSTKNEREAICVPKKREGYRHVEKKISSMTRGTFFGTHSKAKVQHHGGSSVMV